MVRRGSTVRVRQRALFRSRNTRKWAVFVVQADTAGPLLHREGVDGSSQSEGFHKAPASGCCALQRARRSEPLNSLGTAFGDRSGPWCATPGTRACGCRSLRTACTDLLSSTEARSSSAVRTEPYDIDVRGLDSDECEAGYALRAALHNFDQSAGSAGAVFRGLITAPFAFLILFVVAWVAGAIYSALWWVGLAAAIAGGAWLLLSHPS
jgi:hypothetical protein